MQNYNLLHNLYFRDMKIIRKLLFPFSLIYGGITLFRNYLYNTGILSSKTYNLPVICVGNLSTGGTGKTPMIELLAALLKQDYKVAILSRGYKRKTKGFKEVLPNSFVEEVGDEPLQFKRKYPEITVAVCENRQNGIEKLKPEADVILLDDAFQHRKVKASFNILLTPYNDLYSNDFMLPAGNLREPKSGAKRADVIVVTKCPEDVTNSAMQQVKKSLNAQPNQNVFFSKIGYDSNIKNGSTQQPLSYLQKKDFALVTGIANNKPLVNYLKLKGLNFTELAFKDHHNFSATELEVLKQHSLIVTTEKDFMRLQSLSNSLELFYLPIKTEILNEEEAFCQIVMTHVTNFQQPTLQ